MKRALFIAGKTAQAAGLLLLPSAIAAAEVRRSESLAIMIFIAGVAVFGCGTLVCRLVSRSSA